MTTQRTKDDAKKTLERKAKTASQQREANDFSSAEERENRRSLLYNYPPKHKR